MFRFIGDLRRKYHQRKLKKALQYLYPDENSRKDLVRQSNMEQEFGSWITCCSGMLLTEVIPLTDFDITSVIIALKEDLNFTDQGQCNTTSVKWDHSEGINPYKMKWNPYWK